MDPQLEDVARGLEHVRRSGIIHGGLNGVRLRSNSISLFQRDDRCQLNQISVAARHPDRQ